MYQQDDRDIRCAERAQKLEPRHAMLALPPAGRGDLRRNGKRSTIRGG